MRWPSGAARSSDGAAERYEAARTAAYETLFDLELQQGRHAHVVSELGGLLRTTPFNERFCEQLMVALYRSGRQTEALDTFLQMQRRLQTDIGVLPSPTLRRHQQAILTHDPIISRNGSFVTLRG